LRRAFACAALALLVSSAARSAPRSVEIANSALWDHIYGGWLGQAIGVTFGGPTEFGLSWPPPELTYYDHTPVQCADQDDLYVEFVTLLALEDRGPSFSGKDIGRLWPEYLSPGIIWVANRAAYENILKGILPPDSGHPAFNRSYKEIDAQIEADIFGLVAPGMIDVAARNAFEGGHVTNWGDGVYGAVFVAACYAAALYAESPEEIVRLALATVPAQSEYAGMVRRMLAWRKQFGDWRTAREFLADRYLKDNSTVSAIINSGAVIIGLLWGDGDFERTAQISTMCGWDSDCNPSSACGILGCWLGAEKIPGRWKDPMSDIYRNNNLPKLPKEISLTDLAHRTFMVAERFLEASGAERVDFTHGVFGWRIPVEEPVPVPFESATPERIAEWQSQATAKRIGDAVAKFAPGWTVRDCGPDMDPGVLDSYEGRGPVLVLHPLDRDTSCKLVRRVSGGAGPATLKLTVTSYDGSPEADWVLRVTVGGKALLEKTIGRVDGQIEWQESSVDLDHVLAAGPAEIVVEDAPNGWAWEAAYIAELSLQGTVDAPVKDAGASGE